MMNSITFYSNSEEKNLVQQMNEQIAHSNGQLSYDDTEKMWTVFLNSIKQGSFRLIDRPTASNWGERKITFSDPVLRPLIKSAINSLGNSVILKIAMDRKPVAYSKEYCKAFIKEILENGVQPTHPFENWKFFVEIDQHLEMKKTRTLSKDPAIILNQETMNQCTTEEREGLSFDRITAIDAEFFYSLEKRQMRALLKKCPNIVIEVIHNGISYHISASTFLESSYFDRRLFGEFKNLPLTYTSGQLQLHLEILQGTDSKNEALFAPFLKALEAADFQSWSLLSLALAYLGADYCDHTEMKKILLQEISLKQLASEEEASHIMAFLLSLDKDSYTDLQRRLFKASIRYDLFKNTTSLKEINLEKLLEILKKAPNLFPYAIRRYHLPLIALEALYTETIRELEFPDITLTQREMRALIQSGFTTTLDVSGYHLIEKFRSMPFHDLPEALQSNMFFILMTLQLQNSATSSAASWLFDDKLAMLQYVQGNGFLLQFASKELREDLVVVLKAAQGDKESLEYLNKKLKNSFEIVLAAVQTDRSAFLCPLQCASREFQNNREIVLAAVQHDGLALQFASREFQNNREIVLAAVQHDGLALQFASEELKNNREIVLTAIQTNGEALQFASRELKDNREIVLTAIQTNGEALQFASEELKNNREIVLAAIQQNKNAYQFASQELQNNDEIALAYINRKWPTYQFGVGRLKDDREIVLAAVQQCGEVLEFASKELKNNREIVLAAVQQCGEALEFASEELQNDREIVLAAVQRCGQALEFASEELKKNPEIVLAAVRQCGEARQFASEALKNNPEIMFAAVQRRGQALQFANKELKNNFKIVLAAVQENGEALQFASRELKNNREIVLAAVQKDGEALQFASEELRETFEIVLTAVRQNWRALRFANQKLKSDSMIISEIWQQSLSFF